jgi:hypothetical protein
MDKKIIFISPSPVVSPVLQERDSMRALSPGGGEPGIFPSLFLVWNQNLEEERNVKKGKVVPVLN